MLGVDVMLTKISSSGRFVVLDGLHVDREVFEALARWAAKHDVHVQDAIQLAICAFNESALDADTATPTMTPGYQRSSPARAIVERG